MPYTVSAVLTQQKKRIAHELEQAREEIRQAENELGDMRAHAEHLRAQLAEIEGFMGGSESA